MGCLCSVCLLCLILDGRISHERKKRGGGERFSNSRDAAVGVLYYGVM